MSLLGRMAAIPIRFYQRWISPFTPPTCRFRPTCSAYAIGALERHGLVRGTGFAVWRILRCQPFCEGGFDPVPPEQACGRRLQVDTGAPANPPLSAPEPADDAHA